MLHGDDLTAVRGTGSVSAPCAVSTLPSTGTSATTRSRSGSTTATASTSTGCSPATRTGCSTRLARGRCPRWAVARARDGALALSAPAAMSRAGSWRRWSGDCAALVVANVQPQGRRARSSSPPGGSARARGRVRRELGPHRRQGRDLAALRPLPRAEPRDGGRPAPLPRDRPRARRASRAGPRPTCSTGRARARQYEALLPRYGLDPGRPLVLVMGNTPTNAPYEGRFVERLVGWWDGTARDALPAPLPAASARQGLARAVRRGRRVGRASSSRSRATRDLDDLAALLQHGDVVVCNAGTILLDALVNDRPVVCVLYDEGAPPGESWAAKNVIGEHYKELAASGAFHHGGELRRGRGRNRALALRSRTSSRRRADESSARSSARSTAAPRSVSSTRSSAALPAARAGGGR